MSFVYVVTVLMSVSSTVDHMDENGVEWINVYDFLNSTEL
jgi:hypothetical protein